MTQTLLPPLRWLSTADVLEAMPDIDERLDLAQKTMVALDDGMLAKERGGGGQPTAIDLAGLVSELAILLRPAQRAARLLSPLAPPV